MGDYLIELVEELLNPKNLVSGLFILGGAYLGALLAGKSTLKATKEELSYAMYVERVEKTERKSKSEQLIISYLKQIKSSITKLDFLVSEDSNGMNVYDTHDFISEIEFEMNHIGKLKNSINNIPMEYLMVPWFEKIQVVIQQISQLESEINIYFSKSGDKTLVVDNIKSSLALIDEKAGEVEDSISGSKQYTRMMDSVFAERYEKEEKKYNKL
ncbi:hypothetical protein FITA111629_11365 [Filibacter tadaridae]|uniref:Uncharacterized protein n=1 Tax=Filibacter tadaridae TaxID=2483811 RepID=A0A3P5X9R3_9BACL|nr:hypothetical protein [Filibacter tadaridae]VDC25167.1 hypothetical protein FILTAD_01198 [Filibacter tadaridae]